MTDRPDEGIQTEIGSQQLLGPTSQTTAIAEWIQTGFGAVILLGAPGALVMWLVEKYALHDEFLWFLAVPAVLIVLATVIAVPGPMHSARLIAAVLIVPVGCTWALVHATGALHHRENRFVASVSLLTVGHPATRHDVLSVGWQICDALRHRTDQVTIEDALQIRGMPDQDAIDVVRDAHHELCPNLHQS